MATPLIEIAEGDPRLLKALVRFTSGFNCAQSTLFAFLPDEESEMWVAVRDLAAALGGGLVGLGYTCGALAGGAMALSRELIGRGLDKDQRDERLRAFVKDFGCRFGSPFCSGITGRDHESEAVQERCRFLLVGTIRMVDAVLREVDAGRHA